jgi:hypothetical protein
MQAQSSADENARWSVVQVQAAPSRALAALAAAMTLAGAIIAVVAWAPPRTGQRIERTLVAETRPPRFGAAVLTPNAANLVVEVWDAERKALLWTSGPEAQRPAPAAKPRRARPRPAPPPAPTSHFDDR